MNCNEVERRIYLYGELTPREREETDAHITTCATCGKISERVHRERQMLREMLLAPPPVMAPSRITDRVMRAVEKTREERENLTLLTFLSTLIFARPLRYAMAAFSLLLVGVFVNEYHQYGEPALYKHLPQRRGLTELNSASFYEVLQNKEKNPGTTSSVYECVMACLQTEDNVCPDCKIKFTKLIRNDETI
ncbi:MAG TPA: zf-HC2 domain-containing protein [Chryseosolibacter sp.]|nr:zf-HC2 domain-containing protein [Chryseosolibacter sp.]